MWDFFDAAIDGFSFIPQLFRVWRFIFSTNYRKNLLIEYKNQRILGVIADIFLSIIFFIIECYIIYLIIKELFPNNN